MFEKLKEKFRFHAQNLNDLYGTISRVKSQGPMWQHGRCWLSYKVKDPNGEYDYAWTINPEWSIGKPNTLGAGIRFGDCERPLSFHISLPFASFYLSLETKKLQSLSNKLVGKCFDRDTSISFHANTLWINIFADTGMWDSRNKWWQERKFSINFERLLLGKRTFERKCFP